MNKVEIISVPGTAVTFHLKNDTIALETGVQFLRLFPLNTKSNKRIVRCQNEIKAGRIKTPTELITHMNGMVTAKQIRRAWFFEDY